ncbi:radical SAM protein [Rudanella lutea]|uniref:radical SAM protein n=1 Tax=Rudanella lutea TaxID=451374 RepID=UPI00037FA84E|nr:radical SAM protein [Rudanella lutea]
MKPTDAPTPTFCQTVILKVASLCNLNCSYCYMYNLGDTTYRRQPKFMADETVDWLLQRVQSHCRQHGLRQFRFIFHGGEPLLAPPRFYERFVTQARLQLADVRLYFSLQSNGTLLTDAWCELLGRLRIDLSISIDGAPDAHDQFRRDHQGRGSYEAVRRGIELARRSAYLTAPPALMSVINVQADPVAVYEHLADLGMPHLDFALPDAHHGLLPTGLHHWREMDRAPFADWLIRLFDRWLADRPARVSIRLFDQIMGLVLGIDNGFEYFGGRHNEFLIIETDGSIEPVGTLKACGDGFTKVGANVRTHDLDEALAVPLIQLYHLSHHQLAAECRACRLVEVCGGGFLPHRYSPERGFDNPSVYCHDLQRLIVHIQNRLLDLLPAPARRATGLRRLRYEGAPPVRTAFF